MQTVQNVTLFGEKQLLWGNWGKNTTEYFLQSLLAVEDSVRFVLCDDSVKFALVGYYLAQQKTTMERGKQCWENKFQWQRSLLCGPMQSYFVEVFTNFSRFEEGALRVQPFHNQPISCQRKCPSNLCKGQVCLLTQSHLFNLIPGVVLLDFLP